MSIEFIELYDAGDLADERRAVETLRRAAACDHSMDNFFLEVEADLPHQQGFKKTLTGGAGEPLAKRFKTSGVLSETMVNVADAFANRLSAHQRELLAKAINSVDVELYLRLLSSALI